MSKAIVCEIEEEVLKVQQQPSDRLVYSNYFVPLQVAFGGGDVPIVPFYKKNIVLEAIRYGLVDPDVVTRAAEWPALAEMLRQNSVDPAQAIRQVADNVGPSAGSVTYAGNDAALRGLGDAQELLSLVGARLDSGDRSIVAVATKKLEDSRTSLQRYIGGAAPARSQVMRTAIDVPSRVPRTPQPKDEIEFLLGLLQSDVGIAFLDRTRVTPSGLAVGEHVYALGLAPNEEVVLEQKTFSKRQVTFEEQNEREQQFDVEFSSTLSTELQEGLAAQRSHSDTWGLNVSHTGQYSSPPYMFWGSMNASHTIGYTKNVTDAHEESLTRSVKDAQTASQKVSARYRAVHKTTFRVSSEQGFESTSKRTIRNPNRATPITLHYFKLLQKLKIQQERYGARLCWAPSVKGPAVAFMANLERGKQRIREEFEQRKPAKPTQPQQPGADSQGPVTNTENKWRDSPLIDANQWHLDGGMQAYYDADIPCEDGFSWDEDVNSVSASIQVFPDNPRTVTHQLIGKPVAITVAGASVLRARVYLEAAPWIGGPRFTFQVGANFRKVTAIAAQGPAVAEYANAMAAYQTALQAWKDADAAIETQIRAAQDAFVADMLTRLDPVNEMIGQIISNNFPPNVRDECWEIDLWQRIFDWERATFAAYPGWWAEGMLNDPTRSTDDFLNASWARLYLPVRPGMERIALRWIYGKAVNTLLSPEVEKVFDKFEKELRKFRDDIFGTPDEIPPMRGTCPDIEDPFVCLAHWTELLPTDGTHLEVVQGLTSAADADTQKELDNASHLREAMLAREQSIASLNEKAIEKMTQPAALEVKIRTGAETNA